MADLCCVKTSNGWTVANTGIYLRHTTDGWGFDAGLVMFDVTTARWLDKHFGRTDWFDMAWPTRRALLRAVAVFAATDPPPSTGVPRKLAVPRRPDKRRITADGHWELVRLASGQWEIRALSPEAEGVHEHTLCGPERGATFEDARAIAALGTDKISQLAAPRSLNAED